MAGPWSVMDPLAASSSSSSDNSDADSDEDSAAAPNQSEEKKKSALDFEAISKHGYSGGPSVLYVPPPKPESGQEGQDWSWSSGKRKGDNAEEDEEAITERDGTRHNANDGAVQAAAQAIAEYNYAKKQKREKAAEARALSFSQKEKRKRDFGQASRGKNYVEEEKRILRDQGVYSGFDV